MTRQHFAFGILASVAVTLLSSGARGQDAKGALPVAAAGDQVVVKREATHIEPSQKYRVPLFVEPIRTVVLSAPFDGIVRQAEAKPNAKVQQLTDVVRLDNTVAKLRVARAEAALKAMTAEQKLTADKDEVHKTLSQAKVDEAKAEVDLAKYMLEQTSVRAPFAGEIQKILVSEGQFVRTGEPLAILIDTSKLRVEVPVERATAAAGKPIPIKIEAAEVDAKVESVQPLDARFGALREVFDSVASAVLTVDNPDGKFKPGQTVYVPLIPRQPVAEVPNSALLNHPDGQRKVQVVRHLVVREIPVLVMGSVGINRSFVSGAFAEGDEVIYESSHQLGDAFQLKPSSSAATTAATTQGAGAGGQQPSNPGTTPAKTNVGF